MILKKIKELINIGHERSVKAKKNIIISFFVKGISILTGLIMVPLTINYVNQSQYGIWLTLSSIIAWISFLDIGFGNGLRNKFAEYKAIGDDKRVKHYVSTTYGVLSLIFIFVWMFFFLINYKLDWTKILNTTVDLKQELSLVALIVFSFFCLQIILKTVATVLIADQRPAKAALLSTLGQIISLITVYFLTLTTDGSLIYLAWALGLGPFLVLLISSIWFYTSSYKKYAPSFSFFDFKYAKDIMNLGMKFFLIQISFIIVYQTTNIIITQVSGPNDVTIYNIAFKYFSISTMFFAIIISPFWSAFTDAMSRNDYKWMKASYKKLLSVVTVFMIFTVFMLFISKNIYEFWLTDLVEVSFSMSLVVSIFIIINLWNSLFSQLLNGMGKIKIQLYVSLICTVLNIPIAVYLGNKIGVEGVVVSSILLSLISAIYAPYQVKLLLNNKAKGIWNE